MLKLSHVSCLLVLATSISYADANLPPANVELLIPVTGSSTTGTFTKIDIDKVSSDLKVIHSKVCQTSKSNPMASWLSFDDKSKMLIVSDSQDTGFKINFNCNMTAQKSPEMKDVEKMQENRSNY